MFAANTHSGYRKWLQCDVYPKSSSLTISLLHSPSLSDRQDDSICRSIGAGQPYPAAAVPYIAVAWGH